MSKTLRTDEIFVVDQRCFQVVAIGFDEDGDLVICAECLEAKPDEPTKWKFPVAGKRGLREFTAYSRRVLN